MPAIYKQGQGYWTRLMSAVGLGLLALMGAVWIWDLLAAVRFDGVQPIVVSAIGATLFVAVVAGLGYYFFGLHRGFVEFMIATEGEMKKVHWSSRREVLGSTWVVIGLTVFIAILTGVMDAAFSGFFRWLDVLKT